MHVVMRLRKYVDDFLFVKALEERGRRRMGKEFQEGVKLMRMKLKEK